MKEASFQMLGDSSSLGSGQMSLVKNTGLPWTARISSTRHKILGSSLSM